MYLQPYNNPRAGLFSLQRKLHSSTLNLATTREPQASHPPRITEETDPARDSAGPSRGGPSVPGRLQKARSLDVLSDPWSQTQTERDTSISDGRMRSMTSASIESSLSGFSSSSESSESSSSLKGEERRQTPNVSDSERNSPDRSLSDRRSSNTSSESSGSVRSEGSDGAPRVPPRPKTEEILNRCTTMTRKAALATKTRLQIQPEPMHSR